MEFDETDEFGSLMRQNTAISRMMTTYTRFVYLFYIILVLLLFDSIVSEVANSLCVCTGFVERFNYHNDVVAFYQAKRRLNYSFFFLPD